MTLGNDLGEFLLDDVTVVAAPEPSTWTLALAGVFLASSFGSARHGLRDLNCTVAQTDIYFLWGFILVMECLSLDRIKEESVAVLFSSSIYDAEMEAMVIKGLLDANNIPAIIVGPQVLPSLEFQVRVPENCLAQAERLISEAKQAGPEAAAEAEAATEGQTPPG